jgi:hypothetical protein
MRSFFARRPLTFVAATAALAASCSNAGLEPVQAESAKLYDDKLAVRGEICTNTPGDEFFPVKIMFIIDTSNSMLVTDPAVQRVRAVQQVLDRYAGNPSVEFSVIAFDAITSPVTNGFTDRPDLGAITTRLSFSDRLTDYQGALGTAYAELTRDMVDASPAERSRTKYVVIFFSDGVPDPHCDASLGNMQPLQVCTIDRADWPDTFNLPGGTNPNTGSAWTWDDFQGLYPDLEAGKDYNSSAQLQRKVQDILELQEIYNVNEVRFHTGFLFDPNLSQAYIDAYNLDRTVAGNLLRDLAMAGNGSFTEFTSGAEINFLNINYTSTKQVYEMTNFMVWNGSSLPGPLGPEADSDGDGLTDAREDELRLCASDKGGATCNLGGGNFADPLDTDGDGYGDLFEERFRASGFDPKVAATMTTPCTMRDDTDGDGLRDCEERFLTTDPRLYDSDLDRIADGIEVRLGLDPTNGDDAMFDSDSDGTRNKDEALIGYTPFVREPVSALPPKRVYDVGYLGETQDGRNCYDFDVSNILLHTTRGLGNGRGANRVWLSFLEGPRNDPRDFGTGRVACVDVRYIEPDFKSPGDGVISLKESDFYPTGDPGITCVTPNRMEAAP